MVRDVTNKSRFDPLGMQDACSGSGSTCTNKWKAPTGHRYETIVSTNGKHRINDCRHFRSTSSYNLYSGMNQKTRFGFHVSTQGAQHGHAYPLKGAPYVYEYPEVPTYGELLKRFSGTTGAPQLLNFFAELASLRSTILSALSIIRSLGQAGMGYVRLLRPGDYASGYLGYNFGLAPVLDDVSRSLSKIRDIGSRLQRLMDEAGTPVKQTWTSNSSGSFSSQYLAYEGTGRLTGKYTAKAQRFIVASYTIPNRSLVENQARFFASNLGLDNVVSATWEGVPFSFIVDWLVPIGRALESIEPDVFAVNNLTVIEHYVQAKITGSYETTCLTDTYYDPPQLVGRKFTTGDFTAFHRANQLTVPFRVLPGADAPRITAGRGVTGTALAAQKGRKR